MGYKLILILLLPIQLAFGQGNPVITFTGQPKVYNFRKEGTDIISGVPSVILADFKDGNWILYTPDGRYDGSVAALALAKYNDGKNTEVCKKGAPHYTRGLASKALSKDAQERFLSRMVTILGEETANQILKIPMVVVDPQGHTDQIMDMAATNDNKMLVSVSKDKTVRLWDIETGTNIRTFRGKIGSGNEGEVNRVAISPDGSTIAVGGFFDQNKGLRVGDIRFFDLQTGKISGILARSNNATTALAYSKSGNLFVTGNYDNRLRIWTKDKLAYELKLAPDTIPPIVPVLQFEEGISNIALSPDEQTMVVSRYYSTNPAWFKVSEVLDGGVPQSLKYLEKHQNEIVGASFSPTGNILITADYRKAHTWLADGTYVDSRGDVDLAVEGKIQFSPDGTNILMGNTVYGYSSNKSITSKDETGKKVGVFIGNTMVANALDNKIVLWNTTDGSTVKTLKPAINEFKGAVFLNDSLKIGLTLDEPYDIAGKPMVYEKGRINLTFDFRTLQFKFESNNSDVSNLLTYQYQGYSLKRPDAVDGDQNISELRMGNGSSINADGALGTLNSFTYMPNGNVMVATNFYLRLYSSDGREIKRFEGFTGATSSMALSPNGKYLLTMGSDKIVRIWDLTNPGNRIKQNVIVTPLASLYLSANNEWICYIPNQYYASSRKGGQFIGFQFNNGRNKAADFYSFEQMDLTLNRPDLVIKRMGNADTLMLKAYKNAYLKRLKKYKISEENVVSTFDAPTLEILTQSEVVSAKSILLKFIAKAEGAPIKVADIFVNDVRVKTVSLTSTESEMPYETNIELTPGKNKIQVVAIDESGQKSAIETVRIMYKTTVVTKPDLYLVTFGVSNYNNAEYKLQYAAKDANDIIAAYSANKQAFANVKTLSLNNELAVKENIEKAKAFLAQSKVNDMVILFAAGHGLLNNQFDWYFATIDIDFEHPETRGIVFEDLESILDLIPARKKLMLIDACHSGEADKESLSMGEGTGVNATGVKSRGFKKISTTNNSLGLLNSFDLMQQLFADLSKGTGAVIISSAGGAEYAYESAQWNNGVFTFSFLEGIKSGKADLNNDGQIMASEIRDYVAENVKKMTKGKQTPTSRKENLEFDFRVW